MQAQFEKHSGDNVLLVTFTPNDDNEALLLTLLSDQLVVQQRADGSATALIRGPKP